MPRARLGVLRDFRGSEERGAPEVVRKMKFSPFLVVLPLVFGSSTVFAQQKVAQLPDEVLEKAKGIQKDYLVVLPKSFEKGEKHPLVIFLHGSSKVGQKIETIRGLGPTPLFAEDSKYPFVVVSPQAALLPGRGRWWYSEHLDAFLEYVLKKYKIDEERIYLTGLSLGGYGTWNWATKAPRKFAAIAPICGGGRPDRAERITHLPVWAFHGDADEIVPIDASQIMVDALKEAGSKKVKFTVYPGVKHDSWPRAYSTKELYTWFLAHKRTMPAIEKSPWRELPNMPIPRWEAGTVVLDGKLWVFGGYEKPTRSTKRADVFDPKDGSWKKLADMPSAITHMNTVLDGRSIWYAGGFKDGYKGYAIKEVWRYDVDEDKFTAGPDLPSRRGGGGLALVGRKLHFFGGLEVDRLTDAGDHWVLDLDELANGKAEWQSAPPLPSPRNQFGAVTFGGKIWVLGGQFGHDRGQDDQARMDIFDPKTGQWTRGEDLPKPHSHAEGSTFVYRGKVYLLGGMTRVGKRRQIDDEISVLSADGKWSIAGKLPRRLSSPVAAILDGKLYLAGGSLNGAHPQPRMWVRPWDQE